MAHKHNPTVSWFYFQNTPHSVTQQCVSRCYKTFPRWSLGRYLEEHRQNLQFYTNCGTLRGPRQIHMSCQWQWMLKTVSDQSVRQHGSNMGGQTGLMTTGKAVIRRLEEGAGCSWPCSLRTFCYASSVKTSAHTFVNGWSVLNCWTSFSGIVEKN